VELKAALERILEPERVLASALDRIAWANDASVYRLVPRAVVFPRDTSEVRALFAFCRERRLPLTFRAAGTSLSGQAVTDGLLAVVSRHWRGIELLDGGRRVRVEPGAIGGAVNDRLRPHGRKLGPDPASINACMMGGILANNSSGMCCGVADNAYHTLESIRFVLPDGSEFDTALADAAVRFSREAPRLERGLTELRRRVLDSPRLVERIRAKYRMKNTMGYSLNAFLDHRHPLDLLARLLVGSEGTLAFIAQAVLRTVPDPPWKATALLLFPDVPSACAAIGPLAGSGARALELMDRASLRSIEGRPGIDPTLASLPPAAAALLTEYQTQTEEQLASALRAAAAVVPSLPLIVEPRFTRDPVEQGSLWAVRKGLIPSVGAFRRRGTSFIIEDVVFPVERLADGVRELGRLFAAHGYEDAIVFGHAKDGNLHFVLTQAFDDPAEVARYDAFMHELAGVVAVRYGGALKAEHGTGRNMAPFVEAEWGTEALGIMRELKRLVDPDGLLNPGVILNDDPRAHVTYLKDLPQVDEGVDPCIECGFCERVCPSRDLTLTPRQRIVVRRELARLRADPQGAAQLAEIEADHDYAVVETCAADGLCATLCPVAIDTGALVKRLRAAAHGPAARVLAGVAARHFGPLEVAARLSLGAARLAGARIGRELPAAAREASGTGPAGARAVLFVSCVNRISGPAGGGPSAASAAAAVARRAGVPLHVPRATGICCGLAFSSKGFDHAAHRAALGALRSFQSWSAGGSLPIVVDSSPCALTLKTAVAAGGSIGRGLVILDGIEFAHDRLLPQLRPKRVGSCIALHPTCSVRKMELTAKLAALGGACAERFTIPLAAGCCGFAGDRGFVRPELTAAATRAEAAELSRVACSGGYSSSRTCETGLARATGLVWRSFWNLLDEATC
jgi:D-lactate dehydrogenase